MKMLIYSLSAELPDPLFSARGFGECPRFLRLACGPFLVRHRRHCRADVASLADRLAAVDFRLGAAGRLAVDYRPGGFGLGLAVSRSPLLSLLVIYNRLM